MIELDVREKARLARWESAPIQKRRLFGVPNWLVAKHCRAEPGTTRFYQEFAIANDRLRDEYGLERDGMGTLGGKSGDKVDMSPSKALLAAQKAKLSPNVPKNKDVPIGMSPTVEYVPKRTSTCVGCHENEPEKGRNICAGCRKRAWRQSKGEA